MRAVIAAGLVAVVAFYASELTRDWSQAMQTTSLPSLDENTIEASVTIRRATQEVFQFYRDFENLPSFLGDVMAVRQIGPTISRWTIQGPLGVRVSWVIKVRSGQ